jgi:hypothetical protein
LVGAAAFSRIGMDGRRRISWPDRRRAIPHGHGVIVESSPNPTLSENQRSISVLRKRTFVRHLSLELKNQGFFVA